MNEPPCQRASSMGCPNNAGAHHSRILREPSIACVHPTRHAEAAETAASEEGEG